MRTSAERRGIKGKLERMMEKKAVPKSYDQTPRNVNFAEPWKLGNYRGNMSMPSSEFTW
jgi:hypothetical protein